MIRKLCLLSAELHYAFYHVSQDSTLTKQLDPSIHAQKQVSQTHGKLICIRNPILGLFWFIQKGKRQKLTSKIDNLKLINQSDSSTASEFRII